MTRGLGCPSQVPIAWQMLDICWDFLCSLLHVRLLDILCLLEKNRYSDWMWSIKLSLLVVLSEYPCHCNFLSPWSITKRCVRFSHDDRGSVGSCEPVSVCFICLEVHCATINGASYLKCLLCLTVLSFQLSSFLFLYGTFWGNCVFFPGPISSKSNYCPSIFVVEGAAQLQAKSLFSIYHISHV